MKLISVSQQTGGVVEILHRDDLTLGGFAGVREHRLVMDSKAFGDQVNPGTWAGVGNFVYLADARFVPKGETKLHSHKEIDVISVMVDGRIAHEGSLEHGQELSANQVQVQRAGGEGFSHNEVNPNDSMNRMIQIWVLPETPGQPAGYKLYQPKAGALTRVYGGKADQDETFDSHTLIDVALLEPRQNITLDRPFLGYLTRGRGLANDETVSDGDMIRGNRLAFNATEDVLLIVVHDVA